MRIYLIEGREGRAARKFEVAFSPLKRLKEGAIEMSRIENDAVLNQFNQLIEDVLAGTLRRSVFCPWEIAILVDMVRCNLRESSKRENLLRQYRNAMERYLRDGAELPLKLSDYLESLHDTARHATGRRTLGAHGN